MRIILAILLAVSSSVYAKTIASCSALCKYTVGYGVISSLGASHVEATKKLRSKCKSFVYISKDIKVRGFKYFMQGELEDGLLNESCDSLEI